VTETFETLRYTADVVCMRGDHVLTIERGWPPHQGQFALPGGHVDPGETSRAAAARELLEETGLQVDAAELTLVGVYDTPDRDPRGRYVTVAYLATVPAGTTAQAGDDAVAVRWVPVDEPGDLAFDHSRIVADAWRQQLTAGYARQIAAETDANRCPAAHPSDPSPCGGPVAVTVTDPSGAGLDGCEHHGARMLASITGAKVYALPDAPEGAAVRTFKAAGVLPPYAWRQPITR
jgi:ADP-ribose pyrophosphatase YjhB (NUDIX family)